MSGMASRRISVSILVFVEVSLRELGATIDAYGLLQFQSLFSWKYLLEGTGVECRHPIYKSFNPCFRGSISQSISDTSYISFSHKFQSLFSWKYLLELISMKVHCFHPVGFNPCFRGSISQSDAENLIQQAVTCFNPCFRGSISQRSSPFAATVAGKGFNPCFRGSISQRSALEQAYLPP